MPKKEETERQLLRLLGNSPIQIKVEFLHVATHQAKNTANSYLKKFYTTFDQIKDNFYDALIITGAPIEHLEFEEVNYWKELKSIFEWSKTHVFSTLNICWAAQASLYHHFGIKKEQVDAKIFGVFEHDVLIENHSLTRGFTDSFLAPHSRHTKIEEEKLSTIPELDDKNSNLPIEVPYNYYTNDDDTKTPQNTWRGVAYLFYHNWINQVYQLTPYDLKELAK